MTQILRISDAASLAIHAMTVLAADPDRIVAVGDMADAIQVSEAHLSKVMQRLAKEGLVRSVRGPSGGFQLNGDPRQITLLRIYEAIEGSFEDHDCLLDRSRCLWRSCILGDLVHSTNVMVRERLKSTTLKDVAHKVAVGK
jgi:Rrf2 family protein